MAKKADISGKKLIGLAPNDWVRWATGVTDAVAETLISEEFQWVSRESDILIRVTSPTVGAFIALFELQLYYKRTMPRRIRAYVGLAEEKYQLPVYPVLINILPTPDIEIANHYESAFLGLQARQDYRVINLWELSAEETLNRHLSAILPFVPLMNGGKSESVFLRAHSQLRADENLREDDRLSDLMTLLDLFASFVLDKSVILQIGRSDMIEIIEQAPLTQTFIQWGREREAREFALRYLNKRFGMLQTALQERINSLSLERARALDDALPDFNSVADLQAWLDAEPVN
jgi:predicted transposase YdaD